MATEESDYLKYRGKCRELCEAAIQADASLTLVRGHYWEPFWGTNEEHWWTVRSDGAIFDPSCLQFPSKGQGTYTPFNGFVVCEECGKELKEEDAQFAGRYPVCSSKCSRRLVGL